MKEDRSVLLAEAFAHAFFDARACGLSAEEAELHACSKIDRILAEMIRRDRPEDRPAPSFMSARESAIDEQAALDADPWADPWADEGGE
jgi:hypothetical protein